MGIFLSRKSIAAENVISHNNTPTKDNWVGNSNTNRIKRYSNTDEKMEALAEQYMSNIRKKRKKKRMNKVISSSNKVTTNYDAPIVSLYDNTIEDLIDDEYYTQDERQTIEKPKPTINNSSIDITTTSIRWRKAERIGSGAYGNVYLGLNEETGELMGVKQIQLTLQRSKETTIRLKTIKQEISMLSSLSHKNIVAYIDSEITEQYLNIFLEYIPGGSISLLLKKFGSFNEELVIKYTKQILHGLNYLHSHQIMHRDIKGANILVNSQGICKLADFGASVRIADLTIENRKSLHGTPYWMAPEVIKQIGHGRQADIWSVGCTVIEMLTGKPPFYEFKTHVAAMFHIATTTDYPNIPNDLSDEAIDFIHLCLTREPKKRPNCIKLLKHLFLNNKNLHFRNKQRRSIRKANKKQPKNESQMYNFIDQSVNSLYQTALTNPYHIYDEKIIDTIHVMEERKSMELQKKLKLKQQQEKKVKWEKELKKELNYQKKQREKQLKKKKKTNKSSIKCDSFLFKKTCNVF